MSGKAVLIRTQATIILLVVLPIIILGFLTVSRVRNVILENYRASYSSQLNQSGAVLDIIIDNMTDISKQVYNDKELSRILAAQTIAGYNDRSALQIKVNQIKNSSGYIDSVYLYLVNPGVIVSSTRGYEQLTEFNDVSFLNWFGNDNKNFVISNTHPVQTTGQSGSYAHVFSVLTKLPIDATDDYTGAVVVNIKQSSIIDNISGTGNSYILDDEGRIIFSRNENQLYISSDENPYLSGEMDKVSGDFVSFVDGEPYFTVFSKMPDRGWTFASAFSYEEAYKSISMMRNLIIMVSIILGIASLFLSVWFASRTVNPLRDLLSLTKKPDARVKSIKEIVSGAIAYNREVENRLNESLPVYKENFFCNLITKGDYGFQEIEKRLAELGADMPLENLNVALVEFDDYEDLTMVEDYNDSAVKFAVREKLSAVSGRAFNVQTDQNRIALITVAESSGTDMLGRLRSLQWEINEKLGVFISIVLNENSVSAVGLKDAYAECVKGIKYKYVYGKNKVICLNEIEISDGTFEYDYPAEKIKFMLNYIRAGERTNAFNALESVIHQSSVGKSYLYTQYILSHINTAVSSLIKELEIPYESIYTGNENLIENIIKLQSLDEIETAFKAVIEKVINHIQQNKTDKTEKHLNRIIDFISRHYAEQISLIDVCSYAELSQTYVCQLFKTQLHKTFTQYLNNVRVDKACELLKKGDVKIMDIAEKTGFMSSRYFIKVFKEMKGITPGQYVN